MLLTLLPEFIRKEEKSTGAGTERKRKAALICLASSWLVLNRTRKESVRVAATRTEVPRIIFLFVCVLCGFRGAR